MVTEILQRFCLFVVLCLVQVLVLNRIFLFDCAIPLLYVFFPITFHRHYPKWAILLWCFVMGVTIDAFSNTPGVASASLTLTGMLQPYLLELFLPRDAEDNQQVSAASLGMLNYIIFSSILTLLYCMVFFALEAFSLFSWLYWLECVLGSTLLTLVLVFTLETFRK